MMHLFPSAGFSAIRGALVANRGPRLSPVGMDLWVPPTVTLYFIFISSSISLYSSASLDEGSSGASMHSGQVSCFSATWLTLKFPIGSHGFVCPQPSSSCSFDGGIKLDPSDSESKWPEIPPILNQNEDRKKNKYLRKDYLKVQASAHPPLLEFNLLSTAFGTHPYKQ